MSAIDHVFQSLRSQGRVAFIPFVTAGDPDLGFTAAVIRELAARGCSLCEVGIPYSDPIADGPTIQASYSRALERGVRLKGILECLRHVASNGTIPLVTMVSYAIVHRQGLEKFVARAKEAGVAGAVIPDLPVEEAGQLARLTRQQDFSLIQLVTPTTPADRALRIAETSTGFLYYVSVTGITGERTELPVELVDSVSRLKERTDLPICVGFGISRREHVSQLAGVADGLVVGSAIVRHLADIEQRGRDNVVCAIGEFVADLMSTLDGHRGG